MNQLPCDLGEENPPIFLISLTICVPEPWWTTDTALTCTDRAASNCIRTRWTMVCVYYIYIYHIMSICYALNINILLMATRNPVNSPVDLGRLSYEFATLFSTIQAGGKGFCGISACHQQWTRGPWNRYELNINKSHTIHVTGIFTYI